MNLEFDILGYISDEIYVHLKNFIKSQQNPITQLTLRINSAGGSVAAGIGLYNFLKEMPFPIHTYNMGEVSSSAILPYLAGKSRGAESISKFMIHPVKISVNGDLTFYGTQEILHSIRADITNFKTVICRETNSLNGKYDVEHLLKCESLILNAQSAYECGITTNVR